MADSLQDPSFLLKLGDQRRDVVRGPEVVDGRQVVRLVGCARDEEHDGKESDGGGEELAHAERIGPYAPWL